MSNDEYPTSYLTPLTTPSTKALVVKHWCQLDGSLFPFEAFKL